MEMATAAEANLRWLLRKISGILNDPKLTDLYINGAGEGKCFIERGNGIERGTLPYTNADLEDIAINAAALTRQDIAEDAPLVSTVFPGGQRVQIIRPPAVEYGQFSFSIRNPKAHTDTPDDLERGGVFEGTTSSRRIPKRQAEMIQLHKEGRNKAFLELAVQERVPIVFSGTVGSGKTHNLRSFTHAMPLHWRIVTVEKGREMIDIANPNIVNLLYSKGMQSVARVTPLDLVEAALQMGMDALLVQELSDGPGTIAYINAMKSGHWGMSTTHADSAEDTYERIAGMVGDRSPENIRILRRTIQVVVHCVREGDRRRIEQIYYNPPIDPGQEQSRFSQYARELSDAD